MKNSDQVAKRQNIVTEIICSIDKGEKLREEKLDFDSSVDELMWAVMTSKEINQYDLQRDALAQLILTFEHMYERLEPKEEYLVSIQSYLDEGFTLALPDCEKHVFYYRQGDLFTLQKKHDNALKSYSEALLNLRHTMKVGRVMDFSDTNKFVLGFFLTEAEYLKSLGLTYCKIALAGVDYRYEDSIRCLKEALTSIYRLEDLNTLGDIEQWRIDIAKSGVHAQLAYVYFKTWNPKFAWYLVKAIKISWSLKKQGYPLRWEQLKSQFGFKNIK